MGNFDQLLAGKGFIVAGRGARLSLSDVRRLLADQDDQVRIKVGIQTPDLANLPTPGERSQKDSRSALKRVYKKLAPGASSRDLMSAERAASGEAEQKASRKLRRRSRRPRRRRLRSPGSVPHGGTRRPGEGLAETPSDS